MIHIVRYYQERTDKMKALFCYDGPLIENENKYYSPVLTNKMFERYFSVSNELRILIRTRDMTSEEKAKGINQLKTGKISVVECPNLSSPKDMVASWKKAKKIISEEIDKADLLFIRIPSLIGSLAIDIAKSKKKKYLIELVGCPWDSYWNHSLQGKMIAIPYYLKMKKQVSEAKYVVYVTNEFLQHRYPTKGCSENCSNVELPAVDSEVLNKRIDKILNSNGKCIIGTAAGVNVRYKGQQYIIEALGKLKENGITNFEYQLAGEGDQTFLKKVAENNNVTDCVHFLGSLSREKVFEWLDSIDIYAQPSRQEGLPRALIEAMSRGLPCFGARTGGIPELIEDKYIFSNTFKNISEICKILTEFSKDKMLEQSKRNFNESKKYSRNTIAERRMKIFNKYAAEIENER